MKKEYRPVVGYEGLYMISSCGEVVSLDRSYKLPTGLVCKVKRCVIKPKISEERKEFVQLSKNSVRTDHTIKSLIKEAFQDDGGRGVGTSR